MKDHCVYKYVSNGNVVYVGKTDNDLKGRIDCHSKEKKFKPFLKSCEIFVAELKNGTETSVYEKLLINKYLPCLNVTDKHKETSGIEFSEPKWIEYSAYNANKRNRSKGKRAQKSDSEKRAIALKIAIGNKKNAVLKSKATLEAHKASIEFLSLLRDYIIEIGVDNINLWKDIELFCGSISIACINFIPGGLNFEKGQCAALFLRFAVCPKDKKVILRFSDLEIDGQTSVVAFIRQFERIKMEHDAEIERQLKRIEVFNAGIEELQERLKDFVPTV